MSAIQRTVINGVGVDYVRPYDEDESVPQLLFVHGAWGCSALFRGWLEFCGANGINAYALNLQAKDKVSIDEYARTVSGVVDQLGLVVLIGHSMGGLVAQKVASTNHRVVRAVFVASAAPKGVKGRISKAPMFWFHPNYTGAMLIGELFRLRKADAMSHILNEMPADAEQVYSSFGPESGRVFRDMALGVEVGHIPCPTLVVGGDSDLLLNNDLQRGIARKYGSDFISVPASHMIQLEDANNRTLRQIVNWARSKVSLEVFA